MDEETIDTLSLLAERVRSALYEYVAAAPAEVGRDEAAEAVGVTRSLAAFHLDKLVAAGLLDVSYRRLSGRSGPGAGRPAKMYRRAATEHAVSVPPRTYESAARLLAEVVDGAGLEPALQAAARRAGLASSADADLTESLAERGYQPSRDGATIRLRNCPFHALAREFPPLVCGMNLALLEGVLAESPAGREWTARMDARAGECCVVFDSKTNPD